MDTNSYRAALLKVRAMIRGTMTEYQVVEFERPDVGLGQYLDEVLSQPDGPQLPSEIDRSKHGSVLMVWNDCMINHETLEMTWPKLVKAMQEAEKRTDATLENK